MTVAELVGLYLRWADDYYRKPSGRSTRHARNLRYALRGLSQRQTPAEAFTAADLSAWRDAMLSKRISRHTINQRAGWVRAMYRWGARERLIPASVVAELALLAPVKYGRMGVTERARVLSVEWERVRPALAHLPPSLARAASLQWVTGMRASEVLTMHWERVTERAGMRVYRPFEHKNEHHGHARVIVLGRVASTVLGSRGEGWCMPSRHGEPYATNSYAQAIRRACRMARIAPWTSHQLRHAAGTRVARMIDLDAARCLLGHHSVTMTERYIDRTEADAIALAQQLDAGGWSAEVWAELSTIRCVP